MDKPAKPKDTFYLLEEKEPTEKDMNIFNILFLRAMMTAYQRLTIQSTLGEVKRFLISRK